MGSFRSADVRQLLHNKFVVVLGDSIQRSVYKDLVKLLQEDTFLSEAQLKRKGEMSFANDTLVEGGMLTGMHNGTTYREVRQYRTGHHLVRFYFLTRVYSDYLESILSDFQSGPQPDVVITNSCVWDLMRYNHDPLEAYKTNLDVLFRRLKVVLSPECLLIWSMAMPVGYKDHEIPEYTAHNLRGDIVEGNFFSASLADFHRLDVLDMHYHFRGNLRLRCRDAVHWNQIAHRKYTQILLSHISQAWGVEAPKGDKRKASSTVRTAPPHSVTMRKDPYPKLHPRIKEPERCGQGVEYIPGYTSFDGPSIDVIHASSPFVTDSPLLTANITPGYFPPSGPPVSGRSFIGRSFILPNVSPTLSFTPYPNHSPYSQEDWNMKIPSRRPLTHRGDRIHPYNRPSMYLPRMY
ncbi:PC-esterase domain-containing protein 1A-like isoform X2 [Hyla sarda]|uniref:PC-esterase domain-containing protein 1A-like isoform X2 n=1 Tax=Hyla sarda TaxID=327740 RepID=UPI0024C30DD8|nr:PC-esterase domain-containing protein 1A-like isoform X2 [Hyla sarda]